MAGKIFISYRRSETAWAARALFERLWREFPERVFIDIEGLSLGIDYTQVIDEHLDGCEVMLALIGPNWLAEIRSRLEDFDEPDWVRAELARALNRGIPVVPVLIEDAKFPKRAELPENLKDLRNRNGLELHAKHFDAQVGRLVREVRKMLTVAPAPQTLTAVTAPALPEPWMSAEGRDEFGCWAELRVNGVVQRLRWIEPGEFWMGSTEAERKRFGEQGDDSWKKYIQNEAPRHRVKLTRGFWLADTACTQALWQTVAGDNPSDFTGDPNLPVEQVSWDDVTQKFLPALNRQLTGVSAVLPTDAQWEYACRAGTETAYHFGEQIHTDQVNYDGNHPPPGGRKGEYRERTVPVKALPANAWGLYQMHGNVWEWCADARRSYTAEPVEDPDGGQGGVHRVLRGGSWGLGAGWARSASRYGSVRGSRDLSFGFRFALRSIEPGAGGR